jgi:hypothetical protein
MMTVLNIITSFPRIGFWEPEFDCAAPEPFTIAAGVVTVFIGATA